MSKSMKVIINKTVLYDPLSKMSDLFKSGALPITETVLLSAIDGGILLTGTNLETTATVKVRAEVMTAGSACINYKVLLNILKQLNEVPICIEVLPGGVKLTTDSDSFTLPTMDPEEFPAVPVMEDTKKLTISPESLIDGITKTVKFTKRDDMRPIFAGVNMAIEDSRVTFCTTDAHRLGIYHCSSVKPEIMANITIPAGALKIAIQFIKETEPISLKFNETNPCLTSGEFEMITRLFDGHFPNYQAVIPKAEDLTKKLTVKTDLLISAVRKAMITANPVTGTIILDLNKSISVYSVNLNDSMEGKIRISYESYGGEPTQIGFNGRLLLDMLGNIDEDTVLMEIGLPNRAVLIKSPADANLLMLLMPVLITESMPEPKSENVTDETEVEEVEVAQ